MCEAHSSQLSPDYATEDVVFFICYLNTVASLSVIVVDSYVIISNILDFIFNTFPLFKRLWEIRIWGKSVYFGLACNLDLLHV